jgi:hypothetical protein
MSRKLLITNAALALGIAGAVSSAQAWSKDDDGAGVGGIKIGPLGQTFGGPPASGAFASAPLTTKKVRESLTGRQWPSH